MGQGLFQLSGYGNKRLFENLRYRTANFLSIFFTNSDVEFETYLTM